MLPSYFEFHCPVKILAGKNAVDNIPYELEHLKAKRPLIVTDKGVAGAGLIDVVVRSFTDSEIQISALFDETPPDSSLQVVRKLAGLYRDAGSDAFIAVGGGSVIDTTKAANILVTEGGDDLMEYSGAEQLKNPLRPLIVVPTTAGTGSEVTAVAVIADPDRNVKMPLLSPHLMPDVAVIDPRMTLTMPPQITAATGMDALTHAVEAYTSLQKNPASDAYAVAALDLIRQYLRPAVKDGRDETARLAMAVAALMAGIAFSNSMVGIAHSLAHAAGGVSHVPHGLANAILLPFAMDYNREEVDGLYSNLLLPLAGADVYAATLPSKRGLKAIATIRDLNWELNGLCGLPLTLKEAGVAREQLEAIASAAIDDGSLTMNPVDMDKNDALKILTQAFE